MTSKQRIEAFIKLGDELKKQDDFFLEIIQQAVSQNPWFTQENTLNAVIAHANNLNEKDLTNWLTPYGDAFEKSSSKTIGLVLAGNIPMVGFHDVLSCLVAGFNVQIKLSSDDKILIPFVLKKLVALEPAFASRFQLVERLIQFDGIIATGSNNSSRYFDYYFKNVPHIIRKNRNGVAVLSGRKAQRN